MSNSNLPIRQFIENFNNGMYESPDFQTQCDAGWYDWFCKDTSLANKTKKLTAKLKTIIESDKIDLDKHYVFFKNNCPMVGKLYDDFRICDIESGDVIFSITPKSGFEKDNGRAEVWGRENDFKGPIVTGSWKDVKEFFNN